MHYAEQQHTETMASAPRAAGVNGGRVPPSRDYVLGANIAGFKQVADAMLGVI